MPRLIAAILTSALALNAPAHATQNPIALPQLYGSYATTPAGPPVLSMTNKFFKARALAQAFDPIYEERESMLSLDALAELGLRALDPRQPVKVVNVYAEVIGPDGRTTRLGPLESFVPISPAEVVFIAPGKPVRAFKVLSFVEIDNR